MLLEQSSTVIQKFLREASEEASVLADVSEKNQELGAHSISGTGSVTDVENDSI